MSNYVRKILKKRKNVHEIVKMSQNVRKILKMRKNVHEIVKMKKSSWNRENEKKKQFVKWKEKKIREIVKMRTNVRDEVRENWVYNFTNPIFIFRAQRKPRQIISAKLQKWDK